MMEDDVSEEVKAATQATVRPLITESSTAESSTVQVVLEDLGSNLLQIPDYQRDCDQWSIETKSLLIESVINNLTIPAFFFEVLQRDGIEVNEVVDGQQRLTTLSDFYNGKFTMVSADEAPYISPYSLHYAGKGYQDLPITYQQAFKRYRLTIIKLRNLGDMRLEVFRRINQGGTPLSGQDIRLAYYGEGSRAVAFIRIAGIYDCERPSAVRFLSSVEGRFGMRYPWVGPAANFWNEWWSEKDVSRGQVPSEMFLWSMISVDAGRLNNLLKDSGTLSKIRCRYNNAIEEALDSYVSYLNCQDHNAEEPPYFMTYQELTDEFFPKFMTAFAMIVLRGPSITVSKYRAIASVIGSLYKKNVDLDAITPDQWTSLIEFIRKPTEVARANGTTYPYGKGRWEGNGGYYRQFDVVDSIVSKIINEPTKA